MLRSQAAPLGAEGTPWRLSRVGRLRGWPGADAQVSRLHRCLPRARNGRGNFHVGRSAPENGVNTRGVYVADWFHRGTAAGFSSFEALTLSCLRARGPCELIWGPVLKYGLDSRAGSGGFPIQVAMVVRSAPPLPKPTRSGRPVWRSRRCMTVGPRARSVGNL